VAQFLQENGAAKSWELTGRRAWEERASFSDRRCRSAELTAEAIAGFLWPENFWIGD
jgi:hypothetical protein